jgi:Flp pilus assembly protein TadD
MDGDTAAASLECRKALAVDPGFHVARNNLALALALGGDNAGAAEIFGAAGGEGAAHFNLGVVHFAQHRYTAAAEAFDRAAELQPGLVLARLRARQARERAAGTLESEGTHDRR